MYSLLKKILFQLDPETSHHIGMQGLQIAYQTGMSRFIGNKNVNPKNVMGLTFANSIGLAAGLDKNADYVDALAALGFGFIEIGTVTPKPQIGNPKPRLFRLKEHEAIINRMGFNNHGVEYVAKKLEKISYRGILGVNIGKNKDTPLGKSIEDYLIGFRELNKFASYITINISSPNTPGLRALQHSDALTDLLKAMKQEQSNLFASQKRYLPLVVKIAPDLSFDEIDEVAEILLQQKIDGVIATNTTIDREAVANSRYANETGGLSGKPLTARSTQVIARLHATLKNVIPIIASGGVMDEASAKEKLATGAQLLQIYSGFIYEGPGLISRLAVI